jgi:ubiquitin-protein ligase
MDNIMDNYVITQYKSSSCVVEFLLHNAYFAMNCHRANTIFEPIPEYWKNKQNKSDRMQLLDIDINSTDIKTILTKFNINRNIEHIITAIKESYNDIELIEKVNNNTYQLIKFILESNKMMIKSDNLFKSTDVINIKNENNTLNITPENYQKCLETIIQFKLIHTQLIEDKFKNKKTQYLYHGSRYENWYSIMRNGVKIGSKNKYFLNGSAYGNGIYLSNDINLSFNYSKTSPFSIKTEITNKTEDNQIILAIFEVIENPKWHKSGTIFVVDDENSLILRYLLVFNYTNSYYPVLQSIFNTINIKLNSGGIKALEQEKQLMENQNIITIHNKRLLREYQIITKKISNTTNTNIDINYKIQLAQEYNLAKWILYINYTQNKKLEQQIQKLTIPAIEIEIIFKDNYPISPPFIRIVYPRFKTHSKSITTGGSFCIKILTNQGWNPTFNIENIITHIKTTFINDEFEIDEINWNKQYTIDEANYAFTKALAINQWV